MTLPDTIPDAEAQRKKRVRRLIVTVILVSVGIHLVAGLIAGAVIVARYFAEPPAEFKVVKDIRIPAQEREHKMNMAAFDGAAPKPSFTDKMQSLRPTAFALPELPKVPVDQMLPLDPAQILTDQVTSLVGTGGLGSGTGYGSGGGNGSGMGTGFSFMGIKSAGKRILLLFDVSSSVANKAAASGVPLSKIREETLALLKQLPISSRFGLIQFTQNYKPFNNELLPTNDPNREAAKKWLDTEWVEAGSMSAGGSVVSNPKGLVGVLELAAKMQPDVIFLISDASFQWKPGGSIADIPWDDLKKIVRGSLQASGECTINFIGFEMKQEDRREMGGIVRSTHGKIREIK
jgi:hypothetical protein